MRSVMALDIGSGSVKSSLALLDERNGRLVKWLHHEEHEVMVKLDLEMHGYITTPTQDILMDVLKQAKARSVRQFNVQRWVGVATAAFRSAPNGIQVVQHLARELDMELRIISQQEEGLLGWETARTLSGVRSDDLVAFDSGGGSFQLSFYDIDGNFTVLEGPWGSISATTAILRVQKKVPGTSPNPVSLHECMDAFAVIAADMAQLDGASKLKAKLASPSTKLIAIGGETSMFRMIQFCLDGGDVFLASHVRAALEHMLVNRTDDELKAKGFPQTQVLLSKILLFIAVAEHLLMKQPVQYFASNGSCPGVIGATLKNTKMLSSL